MRVPLTARRSKESILKEIIPEYSLEGLMLKLKLQYFGHLMQRTESFEIDGKTVEVATDFIFLGSKITEDGDCSQKIKMLAPWKKSYDQPR